MLWYSKHAITITKKPRFIEQAIWTSIWNPREFHYGKIARLLDTLKRQKPISNLRHIERFIASLISKDKNGRSCEINENWNILYVQNEGKSTFPIIFIRDLHLNDSACIGVRMKILTSTQHEDSN